MLHQALGRNSGGGPASPDTPATDDTTDDITVPALLSRSNRAASATNLPPVLASARPIARSLDLDLLEASLQFSAVGSAPPMIAGGGALATAGGGCGLDNTAFSAAAGTGNSGGPLTGCADAMSPYQLADRMLSGSPRSAGTALGAAGQFSGGAAIGHAATAATAGSYQPASHPWDEGFLEGAGISLPSWAAARSRFAEHHAALSTPTSQGGLNPLSIPSGILGDGFAIADCSYTERPAMMDTPTFEGELHPLRCRGASAGDALSSYAEQAAVVETPTSQGGLFTVGSSPAVPSPALPTHVVSTAIGAPTICEQPTGSLPAWPIGKLL